MNAPVDHRDIEERLSRALADTSARAVPATLRPPVLPLDSRTGRGPARWLPPLLAAAAVVAIAAGIALVAALTRTHNSAPPADISHVPTVSRPAPSTATSTHTTTPSRATGRQSAPATFGPYGFGALKLGMTAQQAMQSGVVSRLVSAGSSCSGFYLKAISTRAPGSIDGYIDPRYGVVLIDAAPGVRTPQGIGLGSTLDAVRAAYPNLVEGQGGPRVTVPGNSAARYQFAYNPTTKIITRLSLVTAGPQSCFS